MAGGGGRSRARMDRSLDEIAAEMHSSEAHDFGTDYKSRPFDGPERHRSSQRHTPYSRREGSADERERGTRRVFVANLSYDTTWQRLKDHMRKCGAVVRCDIFTEPNGSSKGMGLVEFESEEGAERAVSQLANTSLDNRKIMVRKDLRHEERERSGMRSYQTRGRPPPSPATTVFVGNLDYSVTWQKLKDVFKVAGRIVNAEVATDRDNKSKGYGEVQFEEPSHAYNAIALFHGQMLCDRPMIVRMDSKAPYQPDPLQLKLSSKGGLPATGGVNLPLLNALISTLTSATPQVRSDPASGLAPLPVMPPVPLMSLEPAHVPGGHYMEGMEGYPQEAPPYHDDRDMERWRDGERQRSSSYHSILSSSHSRSRGMDSGPHHDRGYPSRSEGSRDHDGPSKSVFVRNLNYSTTWYFLKDQFKRAGPVRHVDLLKSPDGRPQGRAIVYFLEEESAARAIEMFNHSELDGRRLEVRYDRIK